MDIGFLHLHKTVVILFVILLTIKTILLTINQLELLRKIRAKTKMVDALLGVLILMTGVYILYKYETVEFYHAGKIIIMLLAIPLGIVGLKKERKPLAWASLLLFVYIYGVAETKSLTFKKSTDFELAEVEVEVVEELTDAEEGQQLKNLRTQTLVENGRVIYQQLCTQCHGEDGDKGLFKSPMLSQSRLTLDERVAIISNGQGEMPAFNYLKENELEALALYLEQLRK